MLIQILTYHSSCQTQGQKGKGRKIPKLSSCFPPGKERRMLLKYSIYKQEDNHRRLGKQSKDLRQIDSSCSIVFLLPSYLLLFLDCSFSPFLPQRQQDECVLSVKLTVTCTRTTGAPKG